MVRRSTTEWLVGDDRFIEVMHALTQPDVQWSYPERPDVLASLDELIAWVNDSRSYDERIHESGWTSAIKDFLEATGSLGSNVLRAVKAHIEAIRGICRPGVGGDRAFREMLLNEAAAMRLALAESATLVAAWTDLVRSCGRKEASMNTVANRRDIFWAVVRATDRNPVEMSSALLDVLRGDLVGVTFAKLNLGEIETVEVDFQTLRDSPLVEASERLELVERYLRSQPVSKHHVVWFAFRNAYSNPINQDVDFIQLFDARWLHGNLFGDGPFKDRLPSELRQLDHPNSIPNHRDVVLARVDLGTGVFSDAVRVASEQLDALLGIATVGHRFRWERMSGHIHVEDGRIASEYYFEYDERVFRSPEAMDHTARRIGHMLPRIAPMILVRDSDMRDIISALHWWRTANDQPTAASTVLNVRAIELVASRLGEKSWTTYLEKYMKNQWIFAAVSERLYLSVHEALRRRVSTEAQAIQREFFLEATTYKNGQQAFDVSKAVAHLDAIIAFTPSDHPLGRELRTIKRKTSTAAAIQAWCSDLENSWGSSIHRLERVRNSIAHGGPFTEQAELLTYPFGRRLSIWALKESIDGFLESKSLVQSQVDMKTKWDGWRSALSHAISIEAIYDHA